MRLLNFPYTEDALLTIGPAAGVSTVLTSSLTSRAGSAFASLNGNNSAISRALMLRQPSFTSPAVPVTAQTAIDFYPGSGANGALASNSFTGGRTAGPAGGIWENAGTQKFKSIVMSCGNSTSLTN